MLRPDSLYLRGIRTSDQLMCLPSPPPPHTHIHHIGNLLQTTLETPHAPHDVLDVVDVREPNMQGVKELGFHRWQGRGSEEFEKVSKVVAAAGKVIGAEYEHRSGKQQDTPLLTNES